MGHYAVVAAARKEEFRAHVFKSGAPSGCKACSTLGSLPRVAKMYNAVMPNDRDKASENGPTYFQLQTRADVMVLRLQRFFHDEQLEITEEMLALVEKERPSNLIIDLTAVAWGYAILWNRLLTIRNSIAKTNGNLAVCLSGDTLSAAVQLKLDTVFAIYSSVEDALTDR